MSYYFVFLIFCLICPIHARRSGSMGTGRSGGSYYPPSTGLSGNSRVHTYPNAQTIPRATQTQTHSYPHAPGLSGNVRGTNYNQRSEVHHYHYSPPQQISYGSVHHPVFQGSPPVYVYQYKDSGSRFDNLLTGLALYNLGRMSANQDHYNDNHYYRNNNQNYYNREYRGNPDEICKLSIQKTNGECEETRIDCKLMSSFIWDAEREQNNRKTNFVTKTVSVVQNVTKDGNSTVTVQNTTVVDALQVKGPSIKITPGMQCFMIRVSKDTSMLKKEVECGLLQEYATKSLRYGTPQYGSCTRVSPLTSVLVSIATIILFQTLKPQ